MSDLLRKYKSLYSSTTNTFSTGEAVTITPASVVGLPTDTEITLTFDRVDSSGTKTPSKMERIRGTVVGSNFVVSSGGRAVEGTEQTHTSPVVEMVWNADDWNDMVDWGLVEHGQDGKHSSALVTTLKATGAEVNTGTEDAKIVTPKAIADSTIAKTPASAAENVTGTDDAKFITALANVPAFNDSIFRQALINGNMDVDQMVGPYTSGRNNDDVYTLDQWNLISDGNDVFDVSQEAITDLPGSNYAIKLDVETAKRGGIVQFIEARDAQKFKGKYVSISFKVKSANISALRAAVLSWGSTADSITSDIVSAWDATPTWAANWTAENTPADLTVTSSWTTVKIENIYIDSATVNNLAFAIWTPNEETIGDIVYITQVEMNEGPVALPFMPRSFDEELIKCMRFYETSYDYGVLPGTATAYSGVGFPGNNGATTTSYIGTKLMFIVPKRATGATMTFYDGAGTAGKCRRFTLGSSSNDGQNIASDSTDQKSTNVYSSGTSDNTGFVFQYVANARL